MPTADQVTQDEKRAELRRAAKSNQWAEVFRLGVQLLAGSPRQVPMLLTLADLILTIGVNVQAKLSRFLPTVSVTCDFLGPAPMGAWLEARVTVLRTTRNLVFATGLLTLEDASPVARISGILKIGGEPNPAYGPERYLGSSENL